MVSFNYIFFVDQKRLTRINSPHISFLMLITRCQNMLYNDSIQASAFFAKKLEWIFNSKGTKVDHIFCSNSRKLGNCRLIILYKVYQNYKDGRSCRASFIITSYGKISKYHPRNYKYNWAKNCTSVFIG